MVVACRAAKLWQPQAFINLLENILSGQISSVRPPQSSQISNLHSPQEITKIAEPHLQRFPPGSVSPPTLSPRRVSPLGQPDLQFFPPSPSSFRLDDPPHRALNNCSVTCTRDVESRPHPVYARRDSQIMSHRNHTSSPRASFPSISLLTPTFPRFALRIRQSLIAQPRLSAPPFLEFFVCC